MVTKDDKAAAVRELRAAKDALAANKDKTETDEFLKLNSAVAKAEKNVSWWRR